MSSPHFYQADEKFVDDIYGMRPAKEEHQTAIDINPVCTSVPLLTPLVKICKRAYEKLPPKKPYMHDIIWHPCTLSSLMI